MNEFDPELDIHMISQPLLTEEGFLNEACLNELEAAIKNPPKTYDRLAHDPEWNTPRWTHFRDITAALAYWAVHQFAGTEDKSPAPAFAPGLEKIVGYLTACLRPKFNKVGFANLSLCNISKMLYDILYEQNISIFDDWNKKEVLDVHWLDLDALLHNVCLTIRQDRREFDRFNKEFEEDWTKRHNGEKAV